MESPEKSSVSKTEEKVLNFWNKSQTFKKSLEKESPNGEYVFYDGPPFATGLPHYGHLLPGTIKDIIPRYQTMRGKHVTRRWGWDTHGLPIEKLIQEENNLATKKDIENFGVEKFNQAARDSVFRYDKEWKETIPRTGRWVDMENNYTSMDSTFTESVWWGFKELHKKGLVYENFKVMHISPPLETPLSNFEVNQGYKDIVDISVTAEFELVDEAKTFVLAWTTTPWTLPGNVALAVGADIDYVVLEKEDEGDAGTVRFILAKEKVSENFEEGTYKIIKEIKGSELVGKSYKPVFDYYIKDETLENRENGWKIYSDDFVETGEGTGVVHIAPAFGDEDLQLAKRESLPFVQHVNIDGTIKPEVTDFAGLQAKPKENPQQTDIEVIKVLAGKGTLFSKKKITHSYPHCWRTDAPLLNYAMSSWFIKVTDLKDDLVEANEKVNWVPEQVGKARFGNWLKEAKDWSVSRSRFWGTPIPIWKSEDGEVDVLGSIADIKERTKSTNTYRIMRHGEAESNVGGFVSSDNSVKSSLTEKGISDVKNTASSLKGSKPDFIFVSPLERTQETAKLVKKELGLSDEQIITDERLKEIQVGIFNGKPNGEYREFFQSVIERFEKTPEGGENLNDMKNRLGSFIYEIDEKYSNKNILIITHEYAIWMLDALKDGMTKKQASEIKKLGQDYVSPGDVKELEFSYLPHNKDYEIDFHRPYIDEVKYEKNGKTFNRILDVFDTWIDSGSMPFASNHYPFKKDSFDPKSGLFHKSKGFPADFIAEGLDQTRGWFYTLLVLGVGLFGKAPFKNVVVNGLILAEDGRKMSKSLKNYPPIDTVLNKYGVDAMRYFMMSSPAVRSEDLNFNEKGVDEVMKKLINRLDNVCTFYEMYATSEISENAKSENVLDKWIIARLYELENQISKGLDNFELDKASRPIMNFIDDLSTWYVRRSRDRFKNEGQDKDQALQTTKYILIEFSKVIAPFVPFVAEDIYQRVTGLKYTDENQSVHLCDWPKSNTPDEKALKEMSDVRETVSKALEKRAESGMKVRQPLASLTVSTQFGDELNEVLKDEVNVKEIIFDQSAKEVSLDTNLTEELKKEGALRDFVRSIQSMRKNAKLEMNDMIKLKVSPNGKDFVMEFEDEIKNSANVNEVVFEDNEGEEVKILDIVLKVSIN